MKQTYETGISGEETAAKYLETEKGMICLEHRYKTKCGEIDLIMMDGKTLVFVEVKTRKTGMKGQGLAAVNLTKQKRILHAALLYMKWKKCMDSAVRFDVVEIYGDEILYVPNAFQPYGQFYH